MERLLPNPRKDFFVAPRVLRSLELKLNKSLKEVNCVLRTSEQIPKKLWQLAPLDGFEALLLTLCRKA